MPNTRRTIDPNFIYLNWRKDNQNPRVNFLKDHKDSVTIKSTVGPYKNIYSQQIFDKNHVYVWQVKINNGTYFKIGVLKQSEITNSKIKAFSDSKFGFAYFSPGKLRNSSNKQGTEFGKGYGPGDIVSVKFDTIQGKLYFSVNAQDFQLAYDNADFKNGGYVAAVAALHEGANFSLTLPHLQD